MAVPKAPKRKLRNSTLVLAFDPGPKETGWLIGEFGTTNDVIVHSHDIAANDSLLLWSRCASSSGWSYVHIVIEEFVCYGKPVGVDSIAMIHFMGRLHEVLLRSTGVEAEYISHKDVGDHLCHSVKAKNSHIRQVLIDRYGPGKEKAIGLKKRPGPLYGVHTHEWSALALAVTVADRVRGERRT